MKLWWRVAVFIACAGVVALVVQWLQSRQATQWSTTRTRAERGDARAQFDLASGYYYGKVACPVATEANFSGLGGSW